MILPRRMMKRFTRAEADAIIERSKTEAPLELEKGDRLAIFFGALIIFVPFLLAIGGVMGLLYFLIFRVWGA